MDGFEFRGFSPQALKFLSGLKSNNNREWFAKNKPVYENEIKTPASAFCASMVQELAQLTGLSHSSKLFRVYRDVRFSKDKTPYNAHLHISFIPESNLTSPPMWFFGLGTESLSLGCGVFGFDKLELDNFRRRAVGSDSERISGTLEELSGSGIRIGDPHLKRVPGGFPKDHANSNLLLYKGLNGWIDHKDRKWVTEPDMVAKCLSDFRKLKPMFDLLIEA